MKRSMYELLIVDDEYEIRNGLSKYFPWNELGFHVAAQAENGKQALDYLEVNHADVVLCDIRMPVMSGIDLAREIKERKINAKIVFLSGYRDFEYAQKALIYGAQSYIVKSTRYSELIDAFLKIKEELDGQTANRQEAPRKEYGNNSGMDNNHKVIDSIKNYVIEHYKSVTLEDAAEMVHMNPYYISRLFKQKTGENFSDYVMSVKMHKAAELLGKNRYRTYEISDMVGYGNVKSFTRTFKRYFGKSPKEYKNNSQAID